MSNSEINVKHWTIIDLLLHSHLIRERGISSCEACKREKIMKERTEKERLDSTVTYARLKCHRNETSKFSSSSNDGTEKFPIPLVWPTFSPRLSPRKRDREYVCVCMENFFFAALPFPPR